MMDRLAAEQQCYGLGWFFGRFIADQAGVALDSIAARTASWLAGNHESGDVCLDLAAHAGEAWPDGQGITPSLPDWKSALLDSGCVAEAGGTAPMVLDGDRLYLKRFLDYEQAVAEGILQRLSHAVDLDAMRLQQGLARLFADSTDHPDWQQLAAAQAVTRRFAVISGGPGTGKTTSLIKVLALLLQQQPDMRIRLAAPTGKAAARMVESIRDKLSDTIDNGGIDCDENIRALIPTAASTLHRLLGYSPRGYRHDSKNPLLIDCLVVDEASMLDLPMAARLLAALPSACRLILLGDRDQLASVDAGNVLGDITGHGHTISYSPATANQLADLCAADSVDLPVAEAPPAISDAVALLRKSYRFAADSGIGRLARMVNENEAEAAMALLHDAPRDLHWLPEEGTSALINQMAAAFTPYLACDDVHDALKAFEQVRVLCAVHGGPKGLDAVNGALARLFYQRGLLHSPDLAQGMPIMITSNNYDLGLFNGDTGLLWASEDKGTALVACFPQSDGSLKRVPVQLLPEYVPAWAVSVHKSQGSEFDHVLLLLPDADSPVLTRELLYTAITRAKKQFTLYAGEPSIRRMIHSRVSRSTGLATRLGWPA